MSDVDLTVPPEADAQRDAIHVAVVPVFAGQRLYRGERVALKHTGMDPPNGPFVIVAETLQNKCVGVVSPFLEREYVLPSTATWLLLLPGTVTGMRHHWSHPLFDEITDIGVAPAAAAPDPPADDLRKKAEEIAATCGKTYEALMEDARGYAVNDWPTMDNSERYKDVSPEDWVLFWKHFNAVSDVKCDEEWAPYSCSC